MKFDTGTKTQKNLPCPLKKRTKNAIIIMLGVCITKGAHHGNVSKRIFVIIFSSKTFQ